MFRQSRKPYTDNDEVDGAWDDYYRTLIKAEFVDFLKTIDPKFMSAEYFEECMSDQKEEEERLMTSFKAAKLHEI